MYLKESYFLGYFDNILDNRKKVFEISIIIIITIIFMYYHYSCNSGCNNKISGEKDLNILYAWCCLSIAV